MAEPRHVAVVGVSTRTICGVRDHATLLSHALDGGGIACSMHWLQLEQHSLPGSWRAMRAWQRALARELQRERPDAIVLHYSVFAFSYRGVPLFVAPTVAVLRKSGIPVIAVMHELAFPWMQGGVKGTVWAASQRAALIGVVRASTAAIVTVDFRAQWLRSRRWLPARPVAVAPVFSNLPRARVQVPAEHAVPAIGLFGYALDPPTVALVIDALAQLRARGIQLQLQLLGAPGRDSAAGAKWLAAAAAVGVEDALCFSGLLGAQELADALAGCDLLLYVDPMGAASRKGTLAASLASGRALIALEGRRRWEQLLDADAARVLPRTASALADGIAALLGDRPARTALGARGQAFAEDAMGVERTAEAVTTLLDASRS